LTICGQLQWSNITVRNLYFKIFVWYWVAMATVGLVVVLAVAVTQPDSNAKVQRARLEELLDIAGGVAADDYARRGPRAVTTYFNRRKRAAKRRGDGNLKLWLFNAKGREVTGQEVNPRLRSLVNSLFRQTNSASSNTALSDGEAVWAETGDMMAGANWTSDWQGNRYVILANLSGTQQRDPWARIARLLRAPWPLQLLRCIAVLLTTGLICYALARHLTAPIMQLQATVRRLASGDLEARMGPSLGIRKDELAALAHDFDLMADKLQNLLLSQTRLLGDISHELRSPLTRLGVAHDLALHHAATGNLEAIDDDLQRISYEAQRLDALIEQLLTLARLDTQSDGGAQLKTEVNLATLLREIAEDAAFEAQSQSKQIQIGECENCTVIGDAELLRSAIENVVRNALRYTVENSTVLLTLRCTEQAIITVRDHGPGVPESELNNLFRPFYRVAEARDRQSGGAGLGLAITQRAIHTHGGSIVARNAPDGGLEVEIRLPILPLTGH
jgi:two-component system sensor histidine kinase CpxA